MGAFSDATAVARVDDGTWAAEIAPGWDIAGNANGGYLLAITARALAEATGRPDPVSISAHYLAPGRAGPATVSVDVTRRGTRFATAGGLLRGADRPLVQMVGTFADLSRLAPGPEWVDGAPPDLPAVESCATLEATEGFPPPFMGRVDLRLHPDDAGFLTGRPSGTPHLRGWFRLHDEPLDSIGVLLAADAFPPTIFNTDLPIGWTPTIELTAHVRARPEPGWLRGQFVTRFVSGGFLEVDGELWDSTDRLVAQSRQLALVPRAPRG